MEELFELKDLLLVEDMTEMSKDDRLNKIFSLSIVLLLHLIKQAAEQRTTCSWEVSIRHSVQQIKRMNKRRKAKVNDLTLGHWFSLIKARSKAEQGFED